jgi:hypothetical protein
LYYNGEVENAEVNNIVVPEEEKSRKKLYKEKKASVPDAEEEEILEQMKQQKMQRDDPFLHYEGDTDIEEFYEESEDSEPEEQPEEEYFAEKMKQKPAKSGPTTRCHHEPEGSQSYFFVPSSDEDSSPGDLGESDDDGFVQKFQNRSGRKRRVQKPKPRIWYDEARENPHEQIAKKVCFTDVYQFRNALRTFHVAQLRNYHLHRNSNVRIIVDCLEDGCPFYMTASKIANEKTFVIRKLRKEHTCLAHGENTKVTINWLAHQSEQALRTDPNTSVDTLIENVKQKHGVEVAKSKAYRARLKALQVVLGDHKAQYTRIRDYLQAVIDTNPGSRCIVTTRQLVEHPSPNPRFHGLFYCLNASKQGFLNGCRPFLGKLSEIS